MLRDRLLNRETGFLFYGLTPPRENTDQKKIKTIAAKQIARIESVDIDGLVLYDIQDESSRTDSPRPFPFMPTLPPDYYSENYLNGLNIPKIIYKSVGKYSASEFKDWIDNSTENIDYSVFVGSPTREQASGLSLSEAYKIFRDSGSSLLIGGVTIPERHHKRGNEPIRLLNKINNGCSFFISQCVYSINNTK